MSFIAGEKFELALLRSSEIFLHEECEDNRYSKLIDRFRNEQVLFNPLIVGKHNREYFLIDGANRFEALKRLGMKTILAQVVDYSSKDVTLKSWYHLVRGLSFTALKKYLSDNKIKFRKILKAGIKKIPVGSVGVLTHKNEFYILFFDTLLKNYLSSLCKLNKFYETKYRYDRIDSDSDLKSIQSTRDDGLIFLYPDFTKNHIQKIAKSNVKLPAGISRHLIPNRVLHIKYPLMNLKSDRNITQKDSELQELIKKKMEYKKVRLYREPILIFDE
jgi:hypothetical protein